MCAEGVLYAEKDFNLPKHPEIDVPNLEVIKLMQSFKSKEYVTERYAWRHFYWCVRLLAPPPPPALPRCPLLRVLPRGAVVLGGRQRLQLQALHLVSAVALH